MPKVDLKLYSTDAAEGKKITSTVTYVNPEVDNSVLKSFAQQLNTLTTNNYESSDRVETVNLDTEGTNQRALTVENVASGATATITANIGSNEDTFSPVVISSMQSGSTSIRTTTAMEGGSDGKAQRTFSVPTGDGTIYIGITATNGFYADFIRVTINNS